MLSSPSVHSAALRPLVCPLASERGTLLSRYAAASSNGQRLSPARANSAPAQVSTQLQARRISHPRRDMRCVRMRDVLCQWMKV